MFDQYDPGFLPGLIGVVIGYTFRVVLQEITIVCRFPKQLESLQDHVTYYEKQNLPPCSDNWAFVRLDKLLRNASEMAENGRNVPWFHVFSRYRMSKNMAKLVSDIKTDLMFAPICLAQPLEKMPVEDHVSELCVATKEKMAAPPDAAEEMTTVLNQKSALSVSSALRAKDEMSEAAERSRAAAGTAVVGLSRNGGLSYRLISIRIKLILELNNIELTSKKQLTSLKAVVQELRKLQLSSPGYNNGSAICRWLERFDRLLDNACEMVERIKEARPDIFYRYGRGREINRLLSEINAHLQLLPLAALGLIEESPHSMVSHSTTNPAQESFVIPLC